MDFYCKVTGAITVLVLLLTAMILFVGFSAPYSGKFIAEAVAILTSELICGISFFAVRMQSDRVLPNSVGYSISAFVYFIFVLLMAFAVGSSIELRHFVIIHVAGFIITAIMILLFSTTGHDICRQDAADEKRKQIVLGFYNSFSEIMAIAESEFAGDPDIIKALKETLEALRYAADASEKTKEKDAEILSSIGRLKQLLMVHDTDAFKKEFASLQKIILIRERMR